MQNAVNDAIKRDRKKGMATTHSDEGGIYTMDQDSNKIYIKPVPDKEKSDESL